MSDPTESVRRAMVQEVNSQAGDRGRLEARHGQVWDTRELQQDFTVESFCAPFMVATRKETGKRGTLMFQHNPRFYFNWRED